MIEAIRQGLKADGFEVSITKLCRKRRLHPIGYPSFAVTAEERVSF